jgi:hypothetical protein
MTTLEQEQPFLGPATPEHVFASANGRRARFMRVAGSGAGVLALGWLVALGLAILGAASIPGALPGASEPASRPARAVPRADTSRPVHGQRATRALRAPVAAQPLRHHAVAAVALPSTAAARRLSPPERSVAPSAPAAPPAPVATASSRQGWARHGWKAPPGQTRTKPDRRRADPTTAVDGSHGKSGSHSPPKG